MAQFILKNGSMNLELYFRKMTVDQNITERKVQELMKQSVEFERCIDFMTRMIDKYGPELLQELEQERRSQEEKESKATKSNNEEN